MITSLTYRNKLTVNFDSRSNNPSSICRVFAAAVVNRQFCNMLLQDPDTALQKGYLGESFSLSREERDLIVSIRASSLSDLARQVTRSLNTNY